MSKTLKKLEFPAVLAALASCAVSGAAKDRALSLMPHETYDGTLYAQRETSEARRLIGLFGAPSFGDVKPIEGSLQRAEFGGSLNIRELIAIADICRVARRVKAYGGSVNPPLSDWFNMLRPDRFLEEKITNSIADEDTLVDAASPELAAIRRHIRASSAKVRDILHKIISTHGNILQDAIITQRGDRFVVPVKAAHKSELPGLTHDVSGSGQTLFIEPIQVVNANNELKELLGKEQIEIDRILAELSADCANCSDSLRDNYNALTELDFIFAKGKYSYAADASEPKLNREGRIFFKNARHPLLDKKNAVPVTVLLGGEFDTLVITGPNTGGKTVTLKTIGLLSLMAAAGLHIPAAEGSEAAIFDDISADIGDEQSIEQSLSTFSSHIANIVEMFGSDTANKLMLFDELGAGTDPVEGAALAISIIEHARSRGAKVAATTHYAEMKVYALNTAGVENASCEFDIETLKPTYRLLIGIPGKSNAFAISRRLGLDADIIENARERVGQEDKHFEDVLSRLESQRRELERESQAAAQKRREAEETTKEIAKIREYLETERQKASEKAKKEADRILEDAKNAISAAFSEIGEIKKKSADEQNYRELNEARSRLMASINRAKITDAEPTAQALSEPPKSLKVGDAVVIAASSMPATVIEPPDKNGRVKLQAGLLTVTAKLAELRLADAPQKPKRTKPESVSHNVTKGRAAMEVDLRGMMSDEAVLVTEQFIDGAVMSKIPNVTVIHGKGTGALRTAVQSALKRNKNVKSFRLGRFGEGEDGVTIVELAT